MLLGFTGSRNARQMPVDLRGKRDWNSGLCGCYAGDDHEMDTCEYTSPLSSINLISCVVAVGCKACFCPCIVFGQNKTRMDHLANHNSPEPTGETKGGTCAVHGVMTFFSLVGGCVLQVRALLFPFFFVSFTCAS